MSRVASLSSMQCINAVRISDGPSATAQDLAPHACAEESSGGRGAKELDPGREQGLLSAPPGFSVTVSLFEYLASMGWETAGVIGERSSGGVAKT